MIIKSDPHCKVSRINFDRFYQNNHHIISLIFFLLFNELDSTFTRSPLLINIQRMSDDENIVKICFKIWTTPNRIKEGENKSSFSRDFFSTSLTKNILRDDNSLLCWSGFFFLSPEGKHELFAWIYFVHVLYESMARNNLQKGMSGEYIFDSKQGDKLSNLLEP